MGNLTLTTNELLSISSESELIQKLDSIERMIQATNMTCSEHNYLSSVPTSQNNKSTLPLISRPSSTTTQQSQQDSTKSISIPVFNALLNNSLDQTAQYGSESLQEISYELTSSNPDVREIFDTIKHPPLTEQEYDQWLQDIFWQSDLWLRSVSLNPWGVLQLQLEGGEELTPQELELFHIMLTQTYSQFSWITSVVIH